jgi:inositol-phosphate transport system substrate-binding protein
MTKRLLAATALCSVLAGAAAAQNYDIRVWSGGSGEADSYRWEAIEMAADILEREAAIRGEDISINVENMWEFGGWAEFKQAVTLAAEAGDAPEIVVTSHLDIAPWSQAGYIVPVEDYLDLDAWPLVGRLSQPDGHRGVRWRAVGYPAGRRKPPVLLLARAHAGPRLHRRGDRCAARGVLSGEYTLQNVLEDATRAVEMGLVEEGMGFYPRVSNGPDYAQFYQSFGGELLIPKPATSCSIARR